MKLAVIGCGKMGLPLAVLAAARGLDVVGVDTDPHVVQVINRGQSHIDEPGMEGILPEVVARGNLRATGDLQGAISQADTIIVIVPVLLSHTKYADLNIIKKVTAEIGRGMRPGTLVSYETTLPVGTTRSILAPILEGSGLKAERDFYLVFSPERVKSRLVLERLNEVPKVVGGAGPRSLERGVVFYRSILECEVVSVSSLEAAEMVKLAGMIYRDVNIALVNEIARYCDKIGLDLSEIIPVANTNGEAHLLEPGIGVGGHCTPVYPYFLIRDAEQEGVPQRLAEMARKINDGQAEYILNRLKEELGELLGSTILILGLAFRPHVKEDAESPAYLIKRFAESRGAKTFLYDPLYSKEEITQKGFAYRPLYGPDPVDAMILTTAHDAFLSIDWERLKATGVKIFVDGRNCLHHEDIEDVGIKYIGIGRA